MLLRYWWLALHDPITLVREVLSEKLVLMNLVAATEMLSLLDDTQAACDVILLQLDNSQSLVREAAIVALRVINVRLPAHLFSLNIFTKLETISRLDDSPTIRRLAAEFMADAVFERKNEKHS